MNTRYIVICLSRCDYKSENFRVSHDGRETFGTLEEAREAMRADIAEYLEAERGAHPDVRAEDNHIVWANDDCEREARWYIYQV